MPHPAARHARALLAVGDCHARRFAPRAPDTTATPLLGSRLPPAYQHQTSSSPATSDDWASRGVVCLRHSRGPIAPAGHRLGSVLRRRQPDAAPFITRCACEGSGQVPPACPSLLAPILPPRRVLPRLRAIRFYFFRSVRRAFRRAHYVALRTRVSTAGACPPAHWSQAVSPAPRSFTTPGGCGRSGRVTAWLQLAAHAAVEPTLSVRS